MALRIKACHGHCETCGHPDLSDLDLEIHQSPDGQFSFAWACRNLIACTRRVGAKNRETADARR
jgi:hypothetical protein